MLARECLSEFKLDCELRRLSNRTIKGYYNNNARCRTYLERQYGIYEMEEIKPPHLKSYFQERIGQGLSSTDREAERIAEAIKDSIASRPHGHSD